jgi:hypothetical protein
MSPAKRAKQNICTVCLETDEEELLHKHPVLLTKLIRVLLKLCQNQSSDNTSKPGDIQPRQTLGAWKKLKVQSI